MLNDKKSKIFVFWVSQNGCRLPDYILLCLQTWYKNIPNIEITIIDYSNINEYIPNVYNLEKLKMLPLAMQSDAVSVAVLEKHGGIFIDADTLMTKNILSNIDFNDPRLICFGLPQTDKIHLAILISVIPGNKFLQKWREEIALKIENIPEKINWDYIGNSTFTKVFSMPGMPELITVLDRFEQGVIIEATCDAEANDNPYENYIKFYFCNNEENPKKYISRAKFGAIMLHNSWTPEVYKHGSWNEVLQHSCMLSRLFCHILGVGA